MTAIQPNSTIKIGVTGLSANYTDTYSFETLEQQYTEFNSRMLYTFTPDSYQRKERGYVMVEAAEATIDECNYMMFQNTSYDNKWFYAFISDIEYINNAVAKIYYTLDYIQTYYFDYQEQECFIERRHAYNDAIGNNIVPETVDVGEYVGNGDSVDMLANLQDDNEWYVVFCVKPDDVNEPSCIIDKVYTGCTYYAFSCTTAELPFIDSFLRTLVSARFIDCYMVPGFMVYGRFVQGSHKIADSAASISQGLFLTGTSASDTLDGYTPKNNKLYTYPYNFITIDNGSGDVLKLRYEFFENPSIPVIDVRYAISDPPSCIIRPASYKGTTGTALGGYKPYTKEILKMPELPKCTTTIDSFSEWIATNVVATGIGVVSGVLASQAVPALKGFINVHSPDHRKKNGGRDLRYKGYEPVEPNMSGLGPTAVGAMLAQGYMASMQGGISVGSNSGASVVSSGTYGAWLTRMSVNRQYARMIDDYFTMYGYAQNIIDKPFDRYSRAYRLRFTYVKTIDCVVTGNIPQIAKTAIQEIYDRGVRFWKNHGIDFLDYTLPNPTL